MVIPEILFKYLEPQDLRYKRKGCVICYTGRFHNLVVKRLYPIGFIKTNENYEKFLSLTSKQKKHLLRYIKLRLEMRKTLIESGGIRNIIRAKRMTKQQTVELFLNKKLSMKVVNIFMFDRNTDRLTKRDLVKKPDTGLECRYCKIRRYDVDTHNMVCPMCRSYHYSKMFGNSYGERGKPRRGGKQ